MKIFIASAASVLLGLATGWYIEHRHAEREKSEVVEQMMQGTESSDREHAARAARAVQLIQAGETNQAVEVLSAPIAHYYAVAGPNDDRSAKVRALIEQIARTNQIVATRIAETSNKQTKTP